MALPRGPAPGFGPVAHIHPDTNQVPRLLADRPGEIVLTGNNRPGTLFVSGYMS